MSDKFDKAFGILETENVGLVQDDPIRETLSSPTFEPAPSNFDQVFADTDFTSTLTPSDNVPLRTTLLDATKQNPDQFAEAIKLSKQSGVPATIVAPSLEEFRQQAAFDKLDANAMARDFSVTAGFFEDHNNAAQFHDDVETFTGIEQWLREKGTYLGGRFEKGQVNVELSGLQARNVYNILDIPGGTPLTDSELSRVDHLHNLQTAIDHEDDQGQFFKAIGAASEQLPNYIAMANAGAERLGEGLVAGAAAGATVALVAGQAGPQIAAPEEIVTVPAGIVAGGMLGMRSMIPLAKASVVKQILDLETGSSFDEFSRFTDEDGNTIDPQTAAYASIAYGTVASAMEGFSLSKVGKVFSGSKKLFNTMLKQRVKQILRSGTARSKLIELGRDYATMVGTEAVTEGMQQGAQTLFGEFAKFADKDSFTEQDISQILDNVFSVDTLSAVTESMVEGARASAVIGAFGTASTVAINGVKAETQNIVEQRKIDELAEISQSSKAVKRNRDDVRRFVEQASTEDDVVFVPAEKLQDYLQENNIVAEEDPAFKFIAEQIDEAAALNGDVLIPIPDFVANVADSDHFDALRPHMRLSADSLTPFEQSTETAEQRDYVASLMNEAETNAETLQESQQVYESVKQQLIDTGRVTPQVAKMSAQIIPAWAAVMSERTGKPVQQVYTESGLAIEGPFVEKQAELAERATALEQEGVEPTQVEDVTPGVQTLSTKNLGVRMRDLQIADENLKEGKPSVTPDEPVEVTFNKTTGEFELLDGYHRYLALRGGSLDAALESARRGEFPDIKADVKIVEDVQRGGFNVTEDVPDRRTFQQSELKPDLFVSHNLSAENLIFADNVGGLAIPSVAVARTSTGGFDSFGEISLLSHPDLIDPKGGGQSRVFNADVYSPRYPTVLHKIDNTELRKRIEELKESDDATGGRLSLADLEDRGMQDVLDSAAVQYEYLNSVGKAPRIKNKPKVTVPSYLKKFTKMRNRYEISQNAEFKEAAKRYWSEYAEDIADKMTDDPTQRAIILEDDLSTYFNDAGEVYLRHLEDLSGTVERAGRPSEVDFYATKEAIAKKLSSKKTAAEFEAWARDKFADVFIGERLFNGFTYSGNRKYLNHDLDTVVKILKKELRDGEGFNYGVGSIRSTVAKEFKSIKSIQADREQIVSSEEMKVAKDEAETEFQNVIEKLTPYYRYDSKGFGYLDAASNALKEFATRGVRGLSEDYEGVPDDVLKDVGEFMQKLRSMPTEYFEAKIGRAVDIGEFQIALVPKGTKKEAIDILRSKGVKVKKYDPAVGKNEAFEKLQKTNPELFFQEARGFFDPETNLIRLTEASDMSTFLHESAHFFLEMEKQFNPEGMSPINEWFKRNAGEVAKEANRYLKQEAGISDDLISSDHIVQFIDTGSAGADEINSAIIRSTHEQFARGFETYLMEGKAPSLELREAFRAFARWLTDLYRKVRGDLRVNLDDEMRQVLDRMLATEDQINTAEAVNRYQPLFTDAAMAGMTEEAFAAYKKKTQASTDKANETLREKILKELTRQTESWWKEEKAERAERIVTELSNQRVYRAINTLRDKESQVKMDRVMTRTLLGVDKIPPAFRNMTVTGAVGITPDDAAAFLGYNSGSEMFSDILDAKPIKEVANAQAEAEMKVEHGDILNDGTLDEQAQDAAHNEERGRAILQEMKQLAKGQQRPSIDRATIKQLAAENIDRLALNKIRPATYRRAEIKAAQAAQTAMDNNDRGAALRAKTQQAMNFYLWRAAVDAQLEGEKIVRFTRKFSKKTTRTALAKAGNGYLDQIDGILARFQFKGSVKAARDSIETWAAQRAEDGDNIQLTKEVLAETFRMHYKEIPFAQLKGVRDSLKNLDHVARFANKIKRDEELIEFQEVKKEWIDHLDNLPDKFAASRADIVTGGVVKKFNWSISQMTKIPFLASWLDGGKRVGLSHDLMIQPITDATQQEQHLWSQVGKKVMDGINGRSKKDVARHNRKLFIPEIDDHLFGHQLISVALNTGNRSNLEKMLKGEGWVTPDATDEEITVNNPQLQAVLIHMSESDWKLVDLIWRQIDELFPLMAEVHKKTSGLTLAKVEAQKVDTAFGEFRGGYYPIKYDPLRSKRASDTQDKVDEQTQSMFGDGGFIKPVADTGAKIERTQYFAPIRFSLDVVPNHIQEVIHYITHFDAVRQIHKLTNDPEISDKIVSKVGRDEFRQIKPWLNDIAKDGREAPSKTFFEEILRRLRFGTTLGMMGFKASTGVIQISGLSNTYAEVGAKYANRGLRHVVGSPQTMKAAWQFASENSKIMENRVNTMDREVRNAMQKIEGKRGLLAATQEVSMKHIALVQTYMVDLPSWYSGYYKGIDEAKADLNVDDFDSMSDYSAAVENRAIKQADWTVENVQGSGLTKDLPSIMRNQSESNRMFTMFFTFFSSLWNMERDVVRGAKSGRHSATTLAAKAMFLFMIPVAFEMAMRGQLSDDDDDDRSAWERYLTGLALYPVQSVPFVRDVVNGISGEYKFQLTPLAGIIEQGLKGAPKVSEALMTDEELSKGSVKGASKLIGAWFGVPGVSQAWNSGEHLEEIIVDGEEFTVREILFGPDRGK